METETFNLQESELKVGAKMEVHSMTDHFLFTAIIDDIDYDGDFIKIVNAHAPLVPSIIYNSKIKLKGFFNGATVFLYGVVSGSTTEFWKISDLSKQSFSNQRDFYRQSVQTSPAIGRCLPRADEDDSTLPKKEFSCEILNVSGGGMMIHTVEKLSPGWKIEVRNIILNEGREPFTFTATIVRAIECRRGYSYGCQFDTLESRVRERLIQEIFLLQRKEIKSKQF